MFTNEEALLIKEIGLLLNGLGADTTRLRKLYKLTVNFDSLTSEQKQQVQDAFNTLP